MLSWNKTRLATGDAVYEISDGAEVVARGGFAKLGQRVGRGATPTGLHYFFEAPAGRRIWFDSEPALRNLVEAMFAPSLGLGDRHQAALVGLMWAHEQAYKFDVADNLQPLPPSFPGHRDEIS